MSPTMNLRFHVAYPPLESKITGEGEWETKKKKKNLQCSDAKQVDKQDFKKTKQ